MLSYSADSQHQSFAMQKSVHTDTYFVMGSGQHSFWGPCWEVESRPIEAYLDGLLAWRLNYARDVSGNAHRKEVHICWRAVSLLSEEHAQAIKAPYAYFEMLYVLAMRKCEQSVACCWPQVTRTPISWIASGLSPPRHLEVDAACAKMMQTLSAACFPRPIRTFYTKAKDDLPMESAKTANHVVICKERLFWVLSIWAGGVENRFDHASLCIYAEVYIANLLTLKDILLDHS